MTSPRPRRIAVVRGADSEAIQQLFAESASDWRSAGAMVAGVIAEAHGLPDRTCSAGILRDVASEMAYPIYLESAPEGTSCHLDAGGVEAACASVIGRIAASDVVLLSKFGKLEAAGQGLLPAFEAAFAAGKPVITTVSSRHMDAWAAFAPDAVSLEPQKAALADWWRGTGGDRP